MDINFPINIYKELQFILSAFILSHVFLNFISVNANLCYVLISHLYFSKAWLL